MEKTHGHSYVVGDERNLTPAELAYLELFIDASDQGRQFLHGLANARVHTMNDEGMGSIRFVGLGDRRGTPLEARVGFTDRDGTPVMTTLFIDQNGDLYELDVWKVDWSPLQAFPTSRDDLVLALEP